MPAMSQLNPGNRLVERMEAPVQYSEGPASDMAAGNVAAPFNACKESAARPPHPVPPLLEAMPLCICCT